MKPIANHNSELITYLRQMFRADHPNEFKIFLQDKYCLPDIQKRNHILYLDKDYSNSEYVEAEKGYRGYKEDNEINEWLSEVLQVKCFVLRADKNRLMKVQASHLPSALETDRRQSFITEAAIHLINRQSIAQLTIAMYNKYRDDPKEIASCNADIQTFRPTFVVDEEYDDAFCEEEY